MSWEPNFWKETLNAPKCKGWRPCSVLISTQHQEEGSPCSFQSEESNVASGCLSLTSAQVLFYWPKPVTSSSWLQLLAVIFALKIWEQEAGKLSSKKSPKVPSVSEDECTCILNQNKRNRRDSRRNCAFSSSLLEPCSSNDCRMLIFWWSPRAQIEDFVSLLQPQSHA